MIMLPVRRWWAGEIVSLPGLTPQSIVFKDGCAGQAGASGRNGSNPGGRIVATADHPAAAYPWLNSGAIRSASDAALGCILLIVGMIAIWDGRGASFGEWQMLGAGYFPIVLGAAMLATGVALLTRAALVRRPPPTPWSLWSVAIVTAAIAIVVAAAWSVEHDRLLSFGPPEY